MNHCLKHDCPKGYAFIEGFPYQLDTFGSLRLVNILPFELIMSYLLVWEKEDKLSFNSEIN